MKKIIFFLLAITLIITTNSFAGPCSDCDVEKSATVEGEFETGMYKPSGNDRTGSIFSALGKGFYKASDDDHAFGSGNFFLDADLQTDFQKGDKWQRGELFMDLGAYAAGEDNKTGVKGEGLLGTWVQDTKNNDGGEAGNLVRARFEGQNTDVCYNSSTGGFKLDSSSQIHTNFAPNHIDITASEQYEGRVWGEKRCVEGEGGHTIAADLANKIGYSAILGNGATKTSGRNHVEGDTFGNGHLGQDFEVKPNGFSLRQNGNQFSSANSHAH